MHGIRLRAGQIVGRDHMLRQANCQDSHAVVEASSHLVAVVCDGSGSGLHSEVGAALAAEFVAARASALLAEGRPPAELPATLYPETVQFLRQLVGLVRPADPARFAREHLLFTILGIALTADSAVIFAAGDGLIAVDDCLTIRDEGNMPKYIGYHLFDSTALEGEVPPPAFDVCQPEPGWRRLAVATDGFERDRLALLWGWAHPRAVQRKLNAWSDQEHRFRDDATVILVERT